MSPFVSVPPSTATAKRTSVNPLNTATPAEFTALVTVGFGASWLWSTRKSCTSALPGSIRSTLFTSRAESRVTIGGTPFEIEAAGTWVWTAWNEPASRAADASTTTVVSGDGRWKPKSKKPWYTVRGPGTGVETS